MIPRVFELGQGQTWRWTLPVEAGRRYIISADVFGGIDLRIDGERALAQTNIVDAIDGTWFVAPANGQVVVSVTAQTGHARGVLEFEQR